MYFTIAITTLLVSIACVVAPVLFWLYEIGWITVYGDMHISMGGLDKSIFSPLLFIAGIVMFFASLHLIRGIGQWHGRFAKHVLVEASAD